MIGSTPKVMYRIEPQIWQRFIACALYAAKPYNTNKLVLIKNSFTKIKLKIKPWGLYMVKITNVKPKETRVN